MVTRVYHSYLALFVDFKERVCYSFLSLGKSVIINIYVHENSKQKEQVGLAATLWNDPVARFPRALGTD